jgi:NAD(P)-dependent dehydrogenase (short-subunit alcohol dehydrogenase family)
MGAAMAHLFSKAGARVVIGDIDVQRGKSVANECINETGPALFVEADVAVEAAVANLVSTTVEEFGRLDVMVNNAGQSFRGGIEDLEIDEWDRAHDVMLRSVFLGMKLSIPHLRAAGGGAIVSTSSVVGVRPQPANCAYSAMKAGINNLTASVAQIVAKDRIRVNAIAPGTIATPLFLRRFEPGAEEWLLPLAQPLARAGMPEDIAEAALYLASDASAFVTGIVLPVDGGWLVQAPRTPEMLAALEGRREGT